MQKTLTIKVGDTYPKLLKRELLALIAQRDIEIAEMAQMITDLRTERMRAEERVIQLKGVTF